MGRCSRKNLHADARVEPRAGISIRCVIIAGEQFWLWRAVDDEGKVLDLLVQRQRANTAAVKLMRKLMKKPVLCLTRW